tara:strand:- start:438 stop:1070 length:633 start_codon:yes stop_codon:yes gene_type:complete
MTNKRTNFKVMNQKDFIAYLKDKNITYSKITTTTVLGLSVLKVTPDHFRLGERLFELEKGKQLDIKTQLTNIKIEKETDALIKNRKELAIPKSLSKKQLIKIIDSRIQNMGTKGVYHPKRLKPKWNSLTNDSDKLSLFEKYITNKDSSIGFLKLIEVNLCHKTLEAIVIEHPTVINYLKSQNVKDLCICKFSKYENGRAYLIKNNIEPSG